MVNFGQPGQSLDRRNANQIALPINEIIFHSSANLALLKMERPVTSIEPVNLPNTRQCSVGYDRFTTTVDACSSLVSAMGWMAVSLERKQVNLQQLPYVFCESILNSDFKRYDFCAVESQHQALPDLELGSPIVCDNCNDGSGTFLIGLVTSRQRHGQAKIPASFARICAVMPWIKNYVTVASGPQQQPSTSPPVWNPPQTSTSPPIWYPPPPATTPPPVWYPPQPATSPPAWYPPQPATSPPIWYPPSTTRQTRPPPPPPPPPPPSPPPTPLPTTRPPRTPAWYVPTTTVQAPRPVFCYDLPDVNNGAIDNGEWTIGSTRPVVCYHGYEITGMNYITCQVNGQWSMPGQCIQQRRTQPPESTTISSFTEIQPGCNFPDVENGFFVSVNGRMLQLRSYIQGEQIQLKCRDGYVLEGASTYSCAYSGNWYPALGSCRYQVREPVTPVKCNGPFPNIPDGYVDTSGVVPELQVGVHRPIVCYQGYRLVGSSFITCREDGEWTQPRGYCVPSEETTPAYDVWNNRYGENSAYTSWGYQATTRPNWFQSTIAMQQNTCGMTPPVTNGVITSGGSHRVGSTGYVFCDSGYDLVGPASVTCLYNGRWSQPGNCQLRPRDVYCGTLPLLQNGHYVGTNSRVGDVRNVVCDNGYVHSSGSNYIQCLHNGTWSQPGQCVVEPRRISIGCDDSKLPNVEHGFIESGSNLIGTNRRVRCQVGFVLVEPAVTICQESLQWTHPGYCQRSTFESINYGPVGQPDDSLFQATMTGNLNEVRQVLRGNVNVNLRRLEQYCDCGICLGNASALHYALACDHGSAFEIIKLLIERGADVNACESIDGHTPLHLAASEGNVDAAKYLLDRGALVNALTIRSKWTPLMFAAWHGSTEMAALLINSGAYVDPMNVVGQTALDIAAYYGNNDLVNLLLSRGAFV